MELKQSPADYAKQKLIVAAIRLFAEHGVDSVSLRTINRAAGHKNNSALHYHFGSKMGLIAAVDEFIQGHFDSVRDPLLLDLETRSADGAVTIEEVLAALVEPYVTIIEEHDWGYAAVRTIARMEFDGNAQVHELLSRSAGTASKRLARLMQPLLPDLKPREFKRRFNHVVSSTIFGFADYRQLNRSYFGDLSVKRPGELTRFYVRAGVAVLTAPN